MWTSPKLGPNWYLNSSDLGVGACCWSSVQSPALLAGLHCCVACYFPDACLYLWLEAKWQITAVGWYLLAFLARQETSRANLCLTSNCISGICMVWLNTSHDVLTRYFVWCVYYCTLMQTSVSKTVEPYSASLMVEINPIGICLLGKGYRPAGLSP